MLNVRDLNTTGKSDEHSQPINQIRQRTSASFMVIPSIQNFAVEAEHFTVVTEHEWQLVERTNQVRLIQPIPHDLPNQGKPLPLTLILLAHVTIPPRRQDG